MEKQSRLNKVLAFLGKIFGFCLIISLILADVALIKFLVNYII